MRVIVNCTGGGSHSLMLLEHTTVLDLKQHVANKEGVPVSQQLLLFAGRQLFPDSALLLDHLGLDTYSLAHEVVVYMQRQLAAPVRIYLCQPGTAPGQMQPEMVESTSPLTNVMQLLKHRQLTTRPFHMAGAGVAAEGASSRAGKAGTQSSARSSVCSSRCSTDSNASANSTAAAAGVAAGSSGGSVILPSCVVVKRQDGSCCSKLHVTEECAIHQLQSAIEQAEGSFPSYLSFYQAPDGCLHVVAGPSADPCTNSHTVYSRASVPQPIMLAKEPGSGGCVPYSNLVREVAVMP